MTSRILVVPDMTIVTSVVTLEWTVVAALFRAGNKCAKRIKNGATRKANMDQLEKLWSAARKAEDERIDPAVFMKELDTQGLDATVLAALMPVV